MLAQKQFIGCRFGGRHCLYEVIRFHSQIEVCVGRPGYCQYYDGRLPPPVLNTESVAAWFTECPGNPVYEFQH